MKRTIPKTPGSWLALASAVTGAVAPAVPSATAALGAAATVLGLLATYIP